MLPMQSALIPGITIVSLEAHTTRSSGPASWGPFEIASRKVLIEDTILSVFDVIVNCRFCKTKGKYLAADFHKLYGLGTRAFQVLGDAHFTISS